MTTPSPIPDDPVVRHAQFVALTAALGLKDIDVSRLLGFPRSSWSQYRSETIPVPRYAIASLELAVALKQAAPRLYKQKLNDFKICP